MGIEILAKDGPIPRDLILKMSCDGDHGLFNRFDTFEGAQFPDLFSAALSLGWKETYAIRITRDIGGGKVGLARLFLCPECSGKPPAKEAT